MEKTLKEKCCWWDKNYANVYLRHRKQGFLGKYWYKFDYGNYRADVVVVGGGDGVGGGVVVGDGGPAHHDAGRYDDQDDSGDNGITLHMGYAPVQMR